MKSVILLTAVAVFAVAIFVVACSKSKNETPSNPSSEKFVDVSEEDNGNAIHVLPGETIRTFFMSLAIFSPENAGRSFWKRSSPAPVSFSVPSLVFQGKI